MSEPIPPPKPRKSKHADFFRACGFLRPYWRMVAISVVSAFFVGIMFSGGLGAMLPILRVLVNNDTLPDWMNRQVIEKRIGVTLSPDATGTVASVKKQGPADLAGVRVGDQVGDLQTSESRPVVVSGKSIAGNSVPWYMHRAQQVANLFPRDKEWGAVKTIAIVFGAIAVLGIMGNIVRFFQEYLSDKSAISAVNDIRRHLYDHVLHIPMSFFGLSGTSDVTSRLVSDAQVLQDGFKTVLGQSVQEPIKAAFAFALAVWIDWRLTIFIILFAPIMAAVIKKFGKKMRRSARAALQNSSTMLGQIEGTLIGVRVVKAASAERFERRRYATIMKSLVVEQHKMARYEALSTPAMEQVTMLLAGVVLIFASYLLFVRKTLDPSQFLVFLACMAAIGESLRRVSKLTSVLARSNSAAARIFETLDMPVERSRRLAPSPRTRGEGGGEGSSTRAKREHAQTPHPASPRVQGEEKVRVKLPPIARDIVFDRVSFSYANTTSPAVNEVSLRVAKGQSVAIVGRNGSGKTTLLALLPRFFDPQSGRILIDGVDVARATLRSLRSMISIVTQEAIIFPGTIAENIAYGLPRATRKEIEAAAKRAFCHDFIMEKPGAYDASLDGLGGQLSGGQRQRLNIARAILRPSPILILDEATSQVDAESEHLIQKAIESIMHERTTFVIAHRFSTIMSADVIVVMDAGRIVGAGKHDELMTNCATYKQLYERQTMS